MWITPYHQDSDFAFPLRFGDKITIFHEQVDGWQLQIADLAINGGTDAKKQLILPITGAGFGALYIVLSYFELIAKYVDGYIPATTRAGKPGPSFSERYFKQGVYYVFPSLRQDEVDRANVVEHSLRLLYSEVRCGLYHAGMIGRGIILSGDPPVPILLDGAKLQMFINPHLLVPALRRNLVSYVAELQDPANRDIREKFEKRFDYDHPYLGGSLTV